MRVKPLVLGLTVLAAAKTIAAVTVAVLGTIILVGLFPDPFVISILALGWIGLLIFVYGLLVPGKRTQPTTQPPMARQTYCCNCGKPARRDYTYCPHCGKPAMNVVLRPPARIEMKKIIMASILALCFAVTTSAQDKLKPYSFKRARLGASLQELRPLFVDPIFGPMDCLPPDTGITLCTFNSTQRLRSGEVLSFDLLDNKLCRINFGFPSGNLSSVVDEFTTAYGKPVDRKIVKKQMPDKPFDMTMVIWRNGGQSITIEGSGRSGDRSFAVIKDDKRDAEKEGRMRAW